MTNYNLEKEENSYPYKSYGKVLEEKHGDVNFLLKSALQYLVDEYDENLSSVEASHYEDLGYYEIKNFASSHPIEVLDLTWMKKEDVFNFDQNAQCQFVRQINVNIDNLGFSHLPIDDNMFSNIQLVVCNNNSKLNIINQIKNFKSFVSEHASAMSNGIELVGFSPVIAKILEIYAKNYGIDVVSEELYRGKNK